MILPIFTYFYPFYLIFFYSYKRLRRAREKCWILKERIFKNEADSKNIQFQKRYFSLALKLEITGDNYLINPTFTAAWMGKSPSLFGIFIFKLEVRSADTSSMFKLDKARWIAVFPSLLRVSGFTLYFNNNLDKFILMLMIKITLLFARIL